MKSDRAPQELLEARNRQIAAVHKISRLLSSTLDLDERLRDILTVSMQAVDAAAGTVFLYRADDEMLVFQYVVGDKARELTGKAMRATEGIAGEVFQKGDAQITNRPREAAHFNAEVGKNVGFQTESIVTVPLKYQEGRPVGVMQILNKQTGEFTSDDLEALEIVASIAATAIENAQLHREAQAAAVAHAVGDLSHDIKNKLAPISGAIETLQMTIDAALQDLDTSIPDEAPAFLAHYQEATKWLREDAAEMPKMVLEQVETVKQYTKLIADALKGSISEPQLVPNEVAPVIEVQLKELEFTARTRGVKLITDFEATPTFRFDAFLLGRAVGNLVGNAIPETPSGGSVTVRVRTIPEGHFPAGGCLVVEVQDTGRGMPPHVLERILRGDAKSTKPGGTGLGTRIVYNAVQAHHGVFEGESTEDVGTTFRLRIPLLME